jgi:ABC-type transporter Mla MlaB component
MDWIMDNNTHSGRLILQGELTVNQVARLRDELLMALETADKISLDFEAVTEIDLSVLQLCCSAHRTAVKMKKCLELIDSPMEVAKNIAGLNGFLRHQGCGLDQMKTCLWMVKRNAND